jgi:hypothetical protein
MPKVNLDALGSLSNAQSAINTINTNSALIVAAIENSLSRDGTSPNEMEADFDMNSNQILNLPEPVDPTDPIRLGDLEGLLVDLELSGLTGPEGATGPQGPIGPQGPQGTPGGNEQYYINVKDFGAVGDGDTDDTLAIQEAIDYAYDNDYATIYIPSGTYRTTDSIWLDPPLNARVDFSPPTNYNFSLRLIGDGWGGSERPGTTIECDHVNTGLYIGPGQHMGVTGILIRGPSSTVGRWSQLNQVAGMFVLSSAGGAHVTNITDCGVENFKHGYQIAGNYTQLADSTTLTACNAYNCEVGYMVMASQQFINALINCTFENCKICIWSFFNLAIEVIGGNFSVNSQSYGVWDCDTWSALLSAGAADNDFENGFSGTTEYSTMTVHLPGTGLGNLGTMILEQDRFAVITEHFGIIPFYKVDWDGDTDTLTLQFVGDWIATNFDPGGAPFTDFPEIITEIQATTELYAAAQTTVGNSAGIYTKGVHIESADNLTKIMRVAGGWDVSKECRMEATYLNWDVSFSPDFMAGNGKEALNVLAVVFPFIQVDANTSLYIDNLRGDSASRGLVYLSQGAREISGGCYFRNNSINMNVKGPAIQNFPVSSHNRTIESGARGWGDWDRNPFLPGTQQTKPDTFDVFYHNDSGRTPFVGYLPAPWTLPRLTVSQLDALTDTITLGSSATYDDYTTGPVCGDCLYRIGNYDATVGVPQLVRFNHSGWSWGTDITSDWSHIEGSFAIYMDADGIKHMFAGLVIELDYPGPTTVEYIVMAVHHQHGYVEVLPNADNQNRFTRLDGDLPAGNTVFTGSVIRQAAFSITRTGDWSASALDDAHVDGKYFYVGERIWNSVPAIGDPMGWICTVAGEAGDDAVFADMPDLA